MTRATQIKITLVVAGLAIWAFGARTGDGVARWVGIALIAMAFVIRFVKRPDRGDPDAE